MIVLLNAFIKIVYFFVGRADVAPEQGFVFLFT